MNISDYNLSIYGIEITVLMEYLQSKCNYDTANYYPISVESIQNDLGLTYKMQTTLLDKLQSLSVIEVKRIGLPAKRHIRIIGDL